MHCSRSQLRRGQLQLYQENRGLGSYPLHGLKALMGFYIVQACYAMGYNLAIEYLADYEKTWMLDSFRSLNQRVLQEQSRPLTEWLFLEVRLAACPSSCLPLQIIGVYVSWPQTDCHL